ncbi:cytochrome c nitrite reductase subunit NrfD [Vibrio sp. JC009]|uniref:cytochrome c nitrite reductase subunit NrfD n=1 Tax=Vibrio sp. JC009 TaxID=2912314 RepID=UPI0023AF848F|nr:cytochrome c nitrite reductase subunit NrfD [Vibrio sp. JC009]WED20584.1 cytochrome c nitrite reductase subunit NrfD [Vibrio sp. JC009]
MAEAFAVPLVWDWIIAVYLFLAGMSAGCVMISLYLKRKVIEGDPARDGVLKTMAWAAPFGIIAGLTILVFHLTKPLMFWKIMINFNVTSVMSMGVILFQTYMIFLFAWIAIIFRKTIMDFLNTLFRGKLNFVDNIIAKLEKFENSIEWLLAIQAFALAAYTGFLLSALKSFPMLNNPILPILFLFSSLSSGAAASMLFGTVVFKESTGSATIKWVHSFERPVVLFELFVLVAFFTGMIFGGGRAQEAVYAAIGSGFWASWFWWGVIAFGMLIPLALNTFAPSEVRHKVGFVALVTTLSLIGVLMLRTFILYAGQLTVV